MTENKWDHLPNAKHIDRVISILTNNKKELQAAWRNYGKITGTRKFDNSWYAGWGEFEKNGRESIFRGIVSTYINGANVDSSKPHYIAEYAFMALCAWDNCSHMLDDEDIGQLQVLGELGVPAAILLVLIAETNKIIRNNHGRK